MNSPSAAGGSLLGALVVAAVTVWFLWDLFFAAVDRQVLAGGRTWVVAAVALLGALLYSSYRWNRYRRRGY